MTKMTKALVVLAVAASAAFAQETITVKLDGGLLCTTQAGSNTFHIQAWNLGATQPQPAGVGAGVGKAQISNFMVTKQLDDCSTTLFGLVAAGRHLDKVTITQTDTSGRQALMTVLLEGVIVTSYQVAGSETNPVPGETAAFAFTRITITYHGASGITKFGWDLAANRGL